jgi:type II secretion system protein G
MLNKFTKRYKGFTLIELLVVIAIIGILLALSIFGLQGARQSSRDAKRKSDLESIRSALELYKSDKGVYPSEQYCDSSIGSCGSACPCTGTDWNGTIASELEGEYISDLPKDPINDSSHYYYYEPACNQSGSFCGSTIDCTGKGCCAYYLGVALEQGSTYTVCNP